MVGPDGSLSIRAGIANMPHESRQRALAEGVATAEHHLGRIAETVTERGEATLRGSVALGKDGRVHMVLIPVKHFSLSTAMPAIPDALIHIAVDPIMESIIMAVPVVEGVQRELIETEQDANFPVPQRKASAEVRRHEPAQRTVDTRRQPIGGDGMIQVSELADHIMTTLNPVWNIQNLPVAEAPAETSLPDAWDVHFG